MYYGLTSLGVVHTAISLVALLAGFAMLFGQGAISARGAWGKTYFVTTVLTALTGFGIFQHGGFGKPHVLGVLTLLVLAMCALAASGRVFGRLGPYVETVGYSATFLFHWIPAITETTTRLPLGAPLLPNADAPQLQVAAGVLVLLFLAGSALQVRRIRRRAAPLPIGVMPA